MDKLKFLEYLHEQDYHECFEDMVTALFCIEYKQSHGVNRRKNQAGIEADPIEIDGQRIAFQAKYYDEGTRLSDHKADLLRSVEEAAREKVSKLVIYTNKNLTQSPDTRQLSTKGNLNPSKKPRYQLEIEELAQKYKMCVEWQTGSSISTTLQMPQYSHINKIFFGKKDNEIEYTPFYEYAVDIIQAHEPDCIYGDIPLEDGYIEQYISCKGQRTGLKEYLYKWTAGAIVKDEDRILLLYGEPGHGKSSLCYKAMYDFIKSGWLSDKVDNIFCFSLNPSDTDLNQADNLDLKKLLSWGEYRENKLEISDCKNALIFLDGFDELQDSRPDLLISSFIKGSVLRFAKASNARVVVTTRRMSIERELIPNEGIRNAKEIISFEIQPMSYGQQLEWIKAYASYCDSRRIQIKENSSEDQTQEIKWSEKYKRLTDYWNHFKEFQPKRIVQERDRSSILSIPLLFRIIVELQYDPNKFDGSANLYNELFDITWERRPKPQSNSISRDAKEQTIARLAEHALNCFEEDSDSALVDIEFDTSAYYWTYQFYTKRIINNSGDTIADQRKKLRIGFLHRSFYQYFLAKCIMLALLDAENDNDKKLKLFMARLTRKRIDQSTLHYLNELFEMLDSEEKRYLTKRLKQVLVIVRITNAILQETFKMDWVRKGLDTEKKISPLEAGNNLFWNIISICTHCDLYYKNEYGLSYALRNYSNEGIYLAFAELEGADLKGANLKGANLIGANFKEADMREINLRDANLEGANLLDANCSNANLYGANLKNANLIGTCLIASNLVEANLRGANLEQANFHQAVLGRACLVETKLARTDFHSAILEGADFTDAKIWLTIFDKASVLGAKNLDTEMAQITRQDFVYDRHSPWRKYSDFPNEPLMLNRDNCEDLDDTYINTGYAELGETIIKGVNFAKDNLKRAQHKFKEYINTKQKE